MNIEVFFCFFVDWFFSFGMIEKRILLIRKGSFGNLVKWEGLGNMVD